MKISIAELSPSDTALVQRHLRLAMHILESGGYQDLSDVVGAVFKAISRYRTGPQQGMIDINTAELRRLAREAVYALIDTNQERWPKGPLAAGFSPNNLTGDEHDLVLNEFDRIKQRIWPR